MMDCEYQIPALEAFIFFKKGLLEKSTKKPLQLLLSARFGVILIPFELYDYIYYKIIISTSSD